MRKLLKVEVRKLNESYGVFITEKGFLRELTFQSGPDYKTKKEAIKRANDWFENRDFFENNGIFKYKTDKVSV